MPPSTFVDPSGSLTCFLQTASLSSGPTRLTGDPWTASCEHRVRPLPPSNSMFIDPGASALLCQGPRESWEPLTAPHGACLIETMPVLMHAWMDDGRTD